MQWSELLNWSVEHLDAGLQLAFAQALGQELSAKHIQADKLIHSFWGIDRGTDKIKEVFVNVVVANTGRIFSRSLLKLIPGAGSVAAAVVNSGVATSFTYAFGRAVNEVCYKTASRMAKGEKVDITSAFAMDVIMQLIQKYYKKKAE